MLYCLPMDRLGISNNAASKERAIAPYVCLKFTVLHSQSVKASFLCCTLPPSRNTPGGPPYVQREHTNLHKAGTRRPTLETPTPRSHLCVMGARCRPKGLICTFETDNRERPGLSRRQSLIKYLTTGLWISAPSIIHTQRLMSLSEVKERWM